MNKQELRNHFRSVRRKLSAARKQEASQHLLKALMAYSVPFERIASFCSMPDEIAMDELNGTLAKAGRLLLPRCSGEGLRYYRVSDPGALQPSKGGLLEPDPSCSEPTELSRRDLILVPGLAFDEEHFRLGYGKGHFDRFLANHPAIPTAGVGFLEQKSPELLPRDAWDHPVDALLLF